MILDALAWVWLGPGGLLAISAMLLVGIYGGCAGPFWDPLAGSLSRQKGALIGFCVALVAGFLMACFVGGLLYSQAHT